MNGYFFCYSVSATRYIVFTRTHEHEQAKCEIFSTKSVRRRWYIAVFTFLFLGSKQKQSNLNAEYVAEKLEFEYFTIAKYTQNTRFAMLHYQIN